MRAALLAFAVVLGCRPAAPAPAATGNDTALTARRWKYAEYFNRLKRSIRDEWAPQPIWRAMLPVRRLAFGTSDRKTQLRIELWPDGRLASATVAVSSGISELDEEALRAVTAAAPTFSAPPPELVENGRVAFPFTLIFTIR